MKRNSIGGSKPHLPRFQAELSRFLYVFPGGFKDEAFFQHYLAINILPSMATKLRAAHRLSRAVLTDESEGRLQV